MDRYVDDNTFNTNVEKFIEKNTTVNNELENINYWMKCNKLKLNLEKTKLVFFHIQIKIIILEITINKVGIDKT